MDEQLKQLHEAIYKIRSKEKMIRASFEQGVGATRSYLEGRMEEARTTTSKELKAQVKQGYFTEKDSSQILHELNTMFKIEEPEPGILVATFPEYTLNELYLRGIAIKLDDSDGQTKKESKSRRASV